MAKTKKSILFFVMCCVSQSLAMDALLETEQPNLYATSIQAGMLTAKDKSKIQKLQWTAQATESLVPRLALIKAHFANNELAAIVALLHNEPGLKELIMEYPNTGLIVYKTLAHLGKKKESLDLLIKLNEKHQTDADIALLTAQLYAGQNELENALSVINNYLNKAPQQPAKFIFYMLRQKLYAQLGNKKKEIESLEEALRMRPQFAAGWLIFAQLQEKRNQLEGAIKGYSNFLEHSSAKSPFGVIVLNKIEQKLFELVFEQLMQKHPDCDQSKSNTCRKKIMQLFKNKKYKNALEELEKCMKIQKCTAKDRLLKIQLMGAMNKYGEAARQIKEWIFESPNESLWFETLHLLYYAGLDSNVIIKILLEVEKKYPDNLFTKLYLADMFTRNAYFKEAISFHKKALKFTEDSELQTSIFFQLGFLYYETGQYHKIKSALESGKKLGLDYAPLLNLLAYYYVSKENNPDEAEKLMRIVLKQIPDNPHFLDTQALVYYKQKKYVKALALLKKISEQEPEDATIIKHLAKTYHKLDMTQQGVACMQQAANLTYDKKKKKKYLKTATNWKHETQPFDKLRTSPLLCCR